MSEVKERGAKTPCQRWAERKPIFFIKSTFPLWTPPTSHTPSQNQPPPRSPSPLQSSPVSLPIQFNIIMCCRCWYVDMFACIYVHDQKSVHIIKHYILQPSICEYKRKKRFYWWNMEYLSACGNRLCDRPNAAQTQLKPINVI